MDLTQEDYNRRDQALADGGPMFPLPPSVRKRQGLVPEKNSLMAQVKQEVKEDVNRAKEFRNQVSNSVSGNKMGGRRSRNRKQKSRRRSSRARKSRRR